MSLNHLNSPDYSSKSTFDGTEITLSLCDDSESIWNLSVTSVGTKTTHTTSLDFEFSRMLSSTENRMLTCGNMYGAVGAVCWDSEDGTTETHYQTFIYNAQSIQIVNSVIIPLKQIHISIFNNIMGALSEDRTVLMTYLIMEDGSLVREKEYSLLLPIQSYILCPYKWIILLEHQHQLDKNSIGVFNLETKEHKTFEIFVTLPSFSNYKVSFQYVFKFESCYYTNGDENIHLTLSFLDEMTYSMKYSSLTHDRQHNYIDNYDIDIGSSVIAVDSMHSISRNNYYDVERIILCKCVYDMKTYNLIVLQGNLFIHADQEEEIPVYISFNSDYNYLFHISKNFIVIGECICNDKSRITVFRRNITSFVFIDSVYIDVMLIHLVLNTNFLTFSFKKGDIYHCSEWKLGNSHISDKKLIDNRIPAHNEFFLANDWLIFNSHKIGCLSIYNRVTDTHSLYKASEPMTVSGFNNYEFLVNGYLVRLNENNERISSDYLVKSHIKRYIIPSKRDQSELNEEYIKECKSSVVLAITKVIFLTTVIIVVLINL
ncbi:hypothetical protein PCE1_002625 [Barthelona sp. PCE]